MVVINKRYAFTTEPPEGYIKGRSGWKSKLNAVLGSSEQEALSVKDIIDKIGVIEPDLDLAVANKSVGSALSTNSGKTETAKNRYLFIKKNNLKYYYINTQYVDIEQ